jgi:hypothetical protein
VDKQKLKENVSFFSSLIITLQTIYPNSEVLRLFHRNLTGFCLFAFHSDRASVARLGKKLFPTNTSWFMNAYEHATTVTRNGYLYIDTSNESGLKEKFRIRNFLALIYPKTNQLTTSQPIKQTSNKVDSQYMNQPIRAIAKRDHQYLYADLATESPVF